MFLATTGKEDEEYILGQSAPKPAHCCYYYYPIQTVVNVECLKKCLVRFLGGLFSLTAVGLENGFPIKTTLTHAVKNGLISKLLLND